MIYVKYLLEQQILIITFFFRLFLLLSINVRFNFEFSIAVTVSRQHIELFSTNMIWLSFLFYTESLLLFKCIILFTVFIYKCFFKEDDNL